VEEGMGRAILGDHSITCIRGPVSKLKSVFKDRMGNEWQCVYTKEEFEKLPDDARVEAYSNGVLSTKFLKGYLEFVKEISQKIQKVIEIENIVEENEPEIENEAEIV
jgi:hypothetical protein